MDSLDPLQTASHNETMWSQQNRGVGQHAPHVAGVNGVDSHPLDLLGKLLSLGETDERRRVDREKLIDTVLADKSPKRAYDAPQKGVTWGWPVSSYLWTKGVAAGVLLVPLLAQSLGAIPFVTWFVFTAIIISLVFLGLTGLLLIVDLEQPKRFLYVLLRPQWRSWLVKGAYIITAFSFVVPAYGVAAGVAPEHWIEMVLRWSVMLLAVLTATYTAFLFAQAKGRDFWQSPVLPIQMLAHSVMLGAAVLLLAALFNSTEWNQFLATTLIIAAGVHLVCDLIELKLPHSTTGATAAAKLILHGRFRFLFWAGTILGAVIPLLLCLTGQPLALTLAGVLVLIGVYLSQHILVYAPQQLPLS